MEGRKGSSRTLAAQEFHRARRQAAVESILARLTGQPNELLSFEEIAATLRVRGQSSAGTTQIPVAAIVGSVGRYQDFSRSFLPRLESDEDRWVRVRSAARHISELGPIEVYRVGDSYFVVDGNHRVSIARQEGIDYIDAYVTDVRTRVPLPPGASPKDLIIAAEYAAFLEFTRLDELRPDSDTRVSEAGQYYHLENHIEAYRYITEEAEGVTLSDEGAVARWYDEAYLPLVEAIREQMILRYFPGRTETDFFVWLSRHRAALQNELGWAIAPDVTVQNLLQKVEPNASGGRTLRQRLAELVAPERRKVAPPATWAEQRALARYTEHLFANILLPIPADFAVSHDLSSWPALRQAMDLAAAEEAQLCGLYVAPQLPVAPDDVAELDALRRRFNADSAARGLAGSMALESGDVVERVRTLAPLNDLIVVDRDFGRRAEPAPQPSAALLAVLREARRPVLIAAEGERTPPRRAMLAYEDGRESTEALFVAAYLAERWEVELVILPLVDGRGAPGELAHVRDYMAMHEIEARILPAAPGAGPAELVRAATEADVGMIIVAGRRQAHRWLGRDRRAELVSAILGAWTGAVLVTT